MTVVPTCYAVDTFNVLLIAIIIYFSLDWHLFCITYNFLDIIILDKPKMAPAAETKKSAD